MTAVNRTSRLSEISTRFERVSRKLKKLLLRIANLQSSEVGASMLEYALLVGLLSILGIVAIGGVRDIVTESFGRTLIEFARVGIRGN